MITPAPTPVLDEQAAICRRLFEAHFDELCRFAARYVGDIDLARDLVQDAYFRVWRGRSMRPLVPTMRTYLFTIVRNAAVDDLRHRRIVRRAHAACEPLPWVDLETEVLAAETAEQIGRAIDGLPARQREVLRLRWRDGLSYQEVAAQLGVSEKTVGNHVSRAMGHLRTALGAYVA